MNFSIIQKSQLEGTDRVDAEYYQPEYLELARKIRSVKNQSLKEIGVIRSGTTPTDRDDELIDGVVLLKTTDIRNNILSNDDNYYHITPKIAERMLKTKLETNDILVNIVGATLGVIGRASLVPNSFPESNITQAMALIRMKGTVYLPEFVFTYIMSKYGQFQTDRLARPTGQFNLNLEELGQVLVPEISISKQKDVAETIKNVMELQEESKKTYQHAENLLLEELGLKDFKIPEDLSYIVNYSDTENVDRVDADYFQPKYEFLIKKIENKKRLFEFTNKANKSFKTEPDIEYNYIEISDVNVGTGDVIFNKVVGKELPANAKIKVSGGELIISKVRPTRGAVAIIPDEYNQNFVASGAFFIFKVTSPTREFLQVVLRSMIGKLQMERPTTGTSYPTITDQDVENLWIPDVKIETQQKIANLVTKSHEARKKSKELLEEAKRKVEEMIEKGDKN